MRETTSSEWAEIVFEKRNKEYGAYFVRIGYNKNLAIASASTVAFVVLLLIIPAIIKLIDPPVKRIVAKPKITLVDLGTPPSIDRNKPAPQKITLPPPVKKIEKFVTPVVSKKQEEDDMATIDEIKKNETGAAKTDGSDTRFSGVDDGVDGEGEDAIYTFVDQAAEFPGGTAIMGRFLAKNMVYPKPARRAGLEGVVHVAFVVGKTGVISDVEIVKGLSPECDAEAMRVVKIMPPWKPARQNGVPVRSRFVLPLRFKLGMLQQ